MKKKKKTCHCFEGTNFKNNLIKSQNKYRY